MKGLINKVSLKRLCVTQLLVVIAFALLLALSATYCLYRTGQLADDNLRNSSMSALLQNRYQSCLSWIEALHEHVYHGASFDGKNSALAASPGKYQALETERQSLVTLDDLIKQLNKAGEEVQAATEQSRKAALFAAQVRPVAEKMQKQVSALMASRQAAVENNLRRMQSLHAVSMFFVWIFFLGSAVAGILFHRLLGGKILDSIGICSEQMDKMSRGDMTVEFSSSTADNEIGCLATSAAAIGARVKHVLQILTGLTGHLDSSSENLSQSMQNLQTSREQLAQIEQIANAIGDMSHAILEVGKNASHAAYATNQTLGIAVKGNEIVENTVSSMLQIASVIKDSATTIDELGLRSQEIGDIVSVIHEIADQTNLLALNAAIEAARAGDQGRGFAVVADEVRKLAEKTSRATKEITEKVNGIQAMALRSVKAMQANQEQVENGVACAQEASGALKEIVEASRNTTGMVQSIVNSTEQQLAIADEITYNVENVSSAMSNASEASAMIRQEAESLGNVSAQIHKLVEGFRVDEAPAA